jgi:hypothetical protein
MKKNKTFYTLYVDGELYTDIIDDMNSTRSWAVGGIIFLSLAKAEAFKKHLITYDEYSEPRIEIKTIVL